MAIVVMFSPFALDASAAQFDRTSTSANRVAFLDSTVSEGDEIARRAGSQRLPSFAEVATSLSNFDDAAHTPAEIKALNARANETLAYGGGIPPTRDDVLVDQHGRCRWIDNNGAVEYFVPQKSTTELDAFLNNMPAGVRAAGCCPAKIVTFQATDGQSRRFKLDIGREGATSRRGVVQLAHTFQLASSEETVSENYTCANGEWTGGGAARTSVATGCGTHPNNSLWWNTVATQTRPANLDECPYGAGTRTFTWDTEEEMRCLAGTVIPTGNTRVSNLSEAGECAPQMCITTVSTPVVATWSGSMRRQSRHNHTASSSGFGSVGDYYMDGNSGRTVINFPLLRPAENTSIKITATYGAWGPFNGAPRTAEFYIAAGQTIWGGAGNTFYAGGRKGDQFSMTNNAIRMPGYDNSPNLYNVQIEYVTTSTVEAPCTTP